MKHTGTIFDVRRARYQGRRTTWLAAGSKTGHAGRIRTRRRRRHPRWAVETKNLDDELENRADSFYNSNRLSDLHTSYPDDGELVGVSDGISDGEIEGAWVGGGATNAVGARVSKKLSK